MPARRKAATETQDSAGEAVFKRTLQKMLSTPAKPHGEMKKGAAPKRDARSSGKSSKT